MSLDLDTIGYFLYMEEQENRSGDEDIDQEQEDKEGLYNG